MEESLLLLLLLQLIFILLNAVFAGAEIAIITFNDKKLKKLALGGDKRAIRLLSLIEEPAGFLATIQVGITLVNLLSSAVATDNFSYRLQEWFISIGLNISDTVLNALSMIIITIILTYFTVLLGELVPKRLAMKKAESIALAMSGVISVISKIFKPVVWLFTVSTDGLLKLFRVNINQEEEENVEEEIRMILDAGKQKGIVEPDEERMIQRVFEFDDIRIDEIMTHRTQVCILWMDESEEKWQEKIMNSRHTNFPICRESHDQVEGVLFTKDYFRIKKRTRENVLKDAVRTARFVPESTHADVVFRNMQKSRNHFAIVVDEYGGMSGVITMNDLLEQLVGSLDDRRVFSEELPMIEQIDENTWRIHGACDLEEVVNQLGTAFFDEHFNTFGGWVFDRLEIIPEDGSTPEFSYKGYKIMVAKIKDHRLISAVVSRLTSDKINKKEKL
ncbi:hemolysin family protein [Eubacteriaceae bacterium ES3]|nr:hemolysin family protein [Eubacteriaceae bacterium ES3]